MALTERSDVRTGLWLLGGLSVGLSMATQLFEYILYNHEFFGGAYFLRDIADIVRTLDSWGAYGWHARPVIGLVAFGLLFAAPVLFATRRRSDRQVWFAAGCLGVALAGATLGFIARPGDCPAEARYGSIDVVETPAGCDDEPVPWRYLVVGGHLASIAVAISWAGWNWTEGLNRTVPVFIGFLIFVLSVESIRQFFEDIT